MKPKIYFTSAEHKQRWFESLLKIERIYKGGAFDPRYGSALYILTADAGMWHVAQNYVSREGLEIETFLKEVHLSTSESVLTRLAGNLFNPTSLHVDPVEFMVFDESNFAVAMSAISIRYRGLHVTDIKEGE